MTALDIIIILFVVAFAAWGFRQGAILGVSSLVGFIAGAVVGSRLAGAVLAQGAESPYAPLFGLIGGIALGVVVSEIMLTFGLKIRLMFRSHIARRIDGSLGAVLLAAFALGVVWVAAAAVTQSDFAPQVVKLVRKSAVVRQLDAALPPSGGLLNALASIDPFPEINGPAAGVEAPNPKMVRNPAIRADAGSVVRVTGDACGYRIEGSGWVARPNVVVTNAHVVAGEAVSGVTTIDGRELGATAIWFDPEADLALLAVPDLGLAPLNYSTADPKGASGAVLGYPNDGPFDVEAARVGRTASVISRDIYGRGPVTRPMTAFRARVRHGNSGGPLVDSRGVVRGTVFAKSIGRTDEGYAVPNTVLGAALGRADSLRPVGTGGCS